MQKDLSMGSSAVGNVDEDRQTRGFLRGRLGVGGEVTTGKSSRTALTTLAACWGVNKERLFVLAMSTTAPTSAMPQKRGENLCAK
eukprot:CAMPEP_0202014116 /NCGR_PEP_ID=MMETSP0905-20130828/28178_1 /ASSEMBLY_ACC=CAM_ASM_000554 /TAXON_ID=420261 /ORGANISM="Thalassiosira antarctica, Strain CCMP982" /LENGTH=84 /DNA_ID=CAMNT_0048573891 /DNA_START=128 /DNA_END=382 /DNA_ORIENTATION=+